MIRGLLAFALATLVAYLGPLGLPSAADAQQQASPPHIGVLIGITPFSNVPASCRIICASASSATRRQGIASIWG